MKTKFILALDQGTTASKASIINHKGEIVESSQKEFKQHFPKSGWVEHNPHDIWSSQISVVAEVLAKSGLASTDIVSIGITNQRETIIAWNKETSEPLYNALVWQDRRTAPECERLKECPKINNLIRSKTGLIPDAYFSATKIKWILENVPLAAELAKENKIYFGTVDTWLIWKLTQGKEFVTDITNASRTMLYNIHTQCWDKELLDLFNIKESMLPKVRSCSEIFGHTATTLFTNKIPISGVAGDQQSALFGQMCVNKGMVKNTYGTGCFLLMNTGKKPVESKNNLLTTIAWKYNDELEYALEGSVFVGGSAIQWLRDGLNIINNSKDVDILAASVEDNGGVFFVPALTGLGAPHWDPNARGTLIGITRGTSKAHIARATLEGIAFQVYDIVKAMQSDAQLENIELRVDGGASVSDLLMQIQADLFGFKVIRPQIQETTSLGAAYFAGLSIGYWDSIDEIQQQWKVDRIFERKVSAKEIEKLLYYWQKAVNAAKQWI